MGDLLSISEEDFKDLCKMFQVDVLARIRIQREMEALRIASSDKQHFKKSPEPVEPEPEPAAEPEPLDDVTDDDIDSLFGPA